MYDESTAAQGPKERTRRLARRAYERGRLRLGVLPALLTLLFTLISLSLGREALYSVAIGAALSAFAFLFSYRGGVLGRAVLPGLVAGMPPLLLPWVLRSVGHYCASGSCHSLCLLGCVSGGLVAGFLLGKWATNQKARYTFLAASGSLAAGAGLLGCTMAGAAGMVGMTAALLVSSVPILMLTPAPSGAR